MLLTSTTMKQLYLIDAYAFIFRAYYAFAKNPRINTKGQDTSAIFGFVNMINDILNNFKPSHIAVVFDPPGGSFRREFYPDYKANRPATPEPIIFAVPYIKDFLKAMHIPSLEVANYEADDVIGTLSVLAERAGFEVMMATPDKDYGQLVTPNVSILAPQKGGGYEEVGVRDICEKWKVTDPKQVIDILAIMGDTADNFPGVPGIGAVGAAKLIAQYGTIEGILEHADDIKGSIGEKIRNNKENASISKRLATIALDAPIAFEPESYERRYPNLDEVKQILGDLELRSALNNMLRYYAEIDPKMFVAVEEAKSAQAKALEPVITDLFGEVIEKGATPATLGAVDTLLDETIGEEFVSLDLGTEGILEEFIGVLPKAEILYLYALTLGQDNIQKDIPMLCFELEEQNKIYYLHIGHDAAQILSRISLAYNVEQCKLVGHDLKTMLLALRHYSFETPLQLEDTMIAHYLLMPDMGHSLETLASRYLSEELMTFDELIAPQKGSKVVFERVDAERLVHYTAERVHTTKRLHKQMIKELSQREQLHLLRDMEMPLMPILMQMEIDGVLIDERELARQDKAFLAQMSHLEEEIQQLAGEPFNVNSPKQIGEILFEKLGLDAKAKKTKSGTYTTSEEVLEKYQDKHPIVALILEYRGLKKLHSTYITALPELADITGKVHTSFNQTVAATGRLSSSNPNIQNIPIRTEMGRAIRAAFIPEEGCTFLSADYSQIELRLMAHFSQDPHLIDAFVKGQDIHQATAARIAGVSLEEVTGDMRRNAKTANFGIIYGISAFGLADRLGISRTEAKHLISGYFASYPGVERYMNDVIANARARGYVETLAGRRRYLADIDSQNSVIRGYAERNAINAPLQGTAADIIKEAMISIDRAIKERGLKSRMILQVHDELNFNVPMNELEEMKELVRNCMSAVGDKLLVPLEVGVGYGKNWLEAH